MRADRRPLSLSDAAAALLAAAAVVLLALVSGNLLVQADQPGGSRVAPVGFAVALAGAALLGAAALVARGARRSSAPSDRSPT